MKQRRVWAVLSLLIAIASAFVATFSLPGVLLVGMGLVIVIPFAVLAVINFRWRKEVLGQAEPRKKSWMGILIVGLICLLAAFAGFEFSIGLSSIDCGSNCAQSVYDGQQQSRIFEAASLTLGTIIWLLQVLYSRQLYRESLSQETPIEPIQHPQSHTAILLIHLGWSGLVGGMIGFGAYLISSWVVTANLMSSMPYSEDNFQFIQLINLAIGVALGLLAFTITLIVRLNKKDQNSSLE